MIPIPPNVHRSWIDVLGDEFDKPYMTDLHDFLQGRRQSGSTVLPPEPYILSSLSLPLDGVKAVLIAQDPFHGIGQATGHAFSVPPGIRIPPSLRNMFKELNADLGIAPAHHGNLESWARQGVLLLNSVLTVEPSSPGAHQGMGWETFTDRIVQILSETAPPSVFLLWGSYAQKKAARVDARHLVIQSAHPSPLSARRGFFGSRPYSRTNAFLRSAGRGEIDWRLPE